MTTPTRSGRIHSLEAHPQPQSQGEQRLRLLCADWLLSFRCPAEVLRQALVDAHEHPCDEERTPAKRTPAS